MDGLERIKCNNCGQETSLTPEDFDDSKDLTDVYCSESCRYEFETGHSGEEY